MMITPAICKRVGAIALCSALAWACASQTAPFGPPQTSGQITDVAPSAGISVSRKGIELTQTDVIVRAKPDSDPSTRATVTLAAPDDITPDTFSRFGGLASVQWDATGHFRTEKRDGVWWLVDPDGHPFFSAGLNSIRPGAELRTGNRRLTRPFRERFGDVGGWADETGRLLEQMHINTIGSWSDWESLRAAGGEPRPYTVMLNLLDGYREAKGTIDDKESDGRAGGEVFFVFDADFASYAKSEVEKMRAHIGDDPYFMGYFTDNELKLRPDVLDRYLSLEADSDRRSLAEGWLASRQNRQTADLTAITDDDREAFYHVFLHRYFSVTDSAIEYAHPTALNLGSRFHGRERREMSLFEIAGEYVDVISYNYYHVWTVSDRRDIDNWSDAADVPIMITEFYAKGLDIDIPNVSGAGWVVPTQADRGAFFQNFTLGLLEHPNIVGFHWFRYRDNNPALEGFVDASNIDSNKGVLDVAFNPHTPLIEQMKEIHARVYTLRSALLD